MRYYMRDEGSQKLYETDADGEPLHGDDTSYDVDDLRLDDMGSDAGEEYDDGDDESGEDESDPAELADDLDELVGEIADAGAAAATMSALRRVAAMVRRDLEGAGSDDAGVQAAAVKATEPRDTLTPLAERYARQLHGMPLAALVKLGEHEKVATVYSIAQQTQRKG